VHDVSFHAYPQFIAKKDLFFLKLLIPPSLKRADRIIAVSNFTKEELVSRYKTPREKIDVAYNAVAPEFYERSSDNRSDEEFRADYNLPERYILYVGTLQPRKNIPTLVRAFARAKDRLWGIKLVIGGNFSAHNVDPRIRQTIHEEGLEDDVILPGFLPQESLWRFYKLAEIFVSMSYYEGFGVPLLEAMSVDTPVICSDIPPHREVAGDNGAYYVTPDSIDQLAKALYTVSEGSEIKKRLRACGRTRVSAFDWYASAKSVYETYKRAIK
jgi:glycosyltransferase involved in cell wall biosynthesis